MVCRYAPVCPLSTLDAFINIPAIFSHRFKGVFILNDTAAEHIQRAALIRTTGTKLNDWIATIRNHKRFSGSLDIPKILKSSSLELGFSYVLLIHFLPHS